MPASGVDLLAHGDWDHLAGAATTDDGTVRVSGLDRRIVDKDGTGGQPNPPINLQGPRLKVEGDFRLTATMADVGDDGAYLRLYSQVPVVYDEWRQEPPSVRIGVRDGEIDVRVWDGTSDVPAVSETLGSGYSENVRVELLRHDGRFVVYANGVRLGALTVPEVFTDQIWFGADAAAGSTWTLTELRATSVSQDQVRVQTAENLRESTTGDSLRERASDYRPTIDIGSAMASGPLMADSRYRALAAKNFSMVTPENDLKAQFVQPQPGVFAFAEADTIIEFAKQNDMSVHGHTLVWHEALPVWMRRNATEATMNAHIDAVAGHFRGTVAEWDVVNEPMSDDERDYGNRNRGLRSDSPWFESMGEDYIEIAFRRANRVDPEAKLFINEYGVEEEGERWDALYALLKRLVNQGVPIDGVGFQSHAYEAGDRGTAESFRKHVRALNEIGLEARISEMDVLIDQGERAIQAEEFSAMLTVCLEEPNCHSFSIWGFTDKYGSTADTHTYPPTPADALPWDEEFHPKPARDAIRDALG